MVSYSVIILGSGVDVSGTRLPPGDAEFVLSFRCGWQGNEADQKICSKNVDNFRTLVLKYV